MKSIIITLSIVLTASATFYAKDKNLKANQFAGNEIKPNEIDKLALPYTNGHKMDISQADINN